MWSETEEGISLKGRRVVICEDEGVTQLQLSRLLKHAGMQVVGSVNNGQTGIELVLRERPDLVLMDIRMPILDGWEASRAILAAYPVCIVMLTAFSDEESLARARSLGVSGYLVKPITGSVLIPSLQKALWTFQHRDIDAQA